MTTLVRGAGRDDEAPVAEIARLQRPRRAGEMRADLAHPLDDDQVAADRILQLISDARLNHQPLGREHLVVVLPAERAVDDPVVGDILAVAGVPVEQRHAGVPLGVARIVDRRPVERLVRDEVVEQRVAVARRIASTSPRRRSGISRPTSSERGIFGIGSYIRYPSS